MGQAGTKNVFCFCNQKLEERRSKDQESKDKNATLLCTEIQVTKIVNMDETSRLTKLHQYAELAGNVGELARLIIKYKLEKQYLPFDFDKHMGDTDYLSLFSSEEMNYSIMWGIDSWGRFYIAFRYKAEGANEYTKQYINNPNSAYENDEVKLRWFIARPFVATAFQRYKKQDIVVSANDYGPSVFRLLNCPIKNILEEIEPLFKEESKCIRMDKDIKYKWNLVLC